MGELRVLYFEKAKNWTMGKYSHCNRYSSLEFNFVFPHINQFDWPVACGPGRYWEVGRGGAKWAGVGLRTNRVRQRSQQAGASEK